MKRSPQVGRPPIAGGRSPTLVKFPHRTQAVIFDFDFTLADSSRGVVECFQGAFSDLGLSPPEPGKVIRTIGLSLERALWDLTGHSEPDLQERFQARFVAHANRVMTDMTELLPGSRKLLEALRSEGLRMGIVSTKYRFRIVDILEKHRIKHLVSTVVGREDVRLPKPDPEGLRVALESLDVRNDEAIYVGDHTVDAEAADRARVPFIGVLTGTTSREQFAEYRYLRILPSVQEVTTFLRSSQ